MAPRRETQAFPAGSDHPASLGQSMADLNYDQHGAAHGAGYHGDEPRRARPWAGRIGGFVSVALLAGTVYWGYNIAVRNVMGIPVIKAQPGPMRVAPENPGGSVTAYQGLSVNDVAAIGVATPLPEEIALAPRPVDLAAEDVAGLAPEPPAAMIAPQPDALPLTVDRAAADPGLGTVADPAPTAVAATQGMPTLTETPAQDAAPPAADPVEAALIEALGGSPVVSGGQGKSLVPQRRPGHITARAPAPVAPPAQVVETRTLTPADVVAGTQLVQFGAFASTEEAQAQWAELLNRYGDLMGGKAMVVQPVESAGRTFYRLRAEGFADSSDARRFCSAITAEGSDCIPVEMR